LTKSIYSKNYPVVTEDIKTEPVEEKVKEQSGRDHITLDVQSGQQLVCLHKGLCTTFKECMCFLYRHHKQLMGKATGEIEERGEGRGRWKVPYKKCDGARYKHGRKGS